MAYMITWRNKSHFPASILLIGIPNTTCYPRKRNAIQLDVNENN